MPANDFYYFPIANNFIQVILNKNNFNIQIKGKMPTNALGLQQLVKVMSKTANAEP